MCEIQSAKIFSFDWNTIADFFVAPVPVCYIDYAGDADYCCVAPPEPREEKKLLGVEGKKVICSDPVLSGQNKSPIMILRLFQPQNVKIF